MTIDWSKAPEWAMWHTFDEDGIGAWWENRPYAGNILWINYGGKMRNSVIKEPMSHWRETLEKRP